MEKLLYFHYALHQTEYWKYICIYRSSTEITARCLVAEASVAINIQFIQYKSIIFHVCRTKRNILLFLLNKKDKICTCEDPGLLEQDTDV